MRPIAATLLLLPAIAAPGQTKRPIAFPDLMAMKRIADPQLSPSGRWVLFSVTEVSLAQNKKTNHLWVVPATGAGAERDLNLPAGASSAHFAPDGKTIAFTADAPDGTSQIFLAPWSDDSGAAGAPTQLTHLATEADGPVWSPDSKRLLIVSSVYPECSDTPEEEACNRDREEAAAKNPVKARIFDALLYRHWTAFTGEKRTHILVVSAADGKARDLTPRRDVGEAETPNFSLGGPTGYAWSPDSHEIAYVTNLDPVKAASTNNDVFTLRLDDPNPRPVKISTSPGSDDAPAYSPDGRFLAFRSQARPGFESDRFRLMAYDRRAKSTKELLPAFDRWVDEYAWSTDSKSIYLAAGEEGAEPIFRLDLAQNRLAQITETSEGEFNSLALGKDKLIASQMRLDAPAELASIDLRAQSTPMDVLAQTPRPGEPKKLSPLNVPLDYLKTEPLTTLNRPLTSQLALRDAESFWFAGAENTLVQGFLLRPPAFDPKKKYPLKFLIHGGPQGAWGDAWSYRWNAELMAAGGYVVLMINPRGSTGYGQTFTDQVSGDWGGRPFTDLMNGLDAAESRFPFIDKTRECALGASYGGFMADWILTHSNRFQCIVTHDGMFNPASAYGDTEELWFNEWEFRRPADFPTPGHPGAPAQPWRYTALPADQDPFRKWSPLLHIQNAKTPTLVIHSQLDYRLDVSEGYQLFTVLQRLNVPSKMLYFPDEGHWVLKPRNSELWNATVSDWCDRWTHSNRYASQ